MTNTKEKRIKAMKEVGDVGKVDEVLQTKISTVAHEIEKILLDNHLGLQPFIQYTPTGIFPQIKLVPTNEKENNE